MAGIVEGKLKALGITLAEPAKPIANYVPYVRCGNMLTVSGQICLDGNGKLVAKGQLGAGVSVEDGQKAARACAISLITQVKAALGDLDKVKQVVRLGGFINSAPGFTDGPKVMNGASDLIVAVFGDKGKHARSTTLGADPREGDDAGNSLRQSSSGCGRQQLDGFIDFDLPVIDLLLTLDTEGRPWHSGHALWQDIFFAAQAYPVSTISNPGKRAMNLAERVRIPVKISNG